MMHLIKRVSGAGAADTAHTLSTPVGKKLIVRQVTVAYSAAPTQAGVTITLNSGKGAAYDTTLFTGSANARYNVYTPDKPIYLMEDDVIDVLAPAAGGVITAATTIVCEEL